MISVIIPLYNKELHVGRAISSVLSQSYQDFEIIIVDDGSTDDSANIVKLYKDFRITLIHQENAGVSSARNRGIEEATGDLIAFLDADDEWMPDHLRTIIRLAQKYPYAGIYASSYKITSLTGKVTSPKLIGIPLPPWEGIIPSYFNTASSGAPPVCSSSVCIPKYIFQDVGQFCLGKRMGEDIDMWGRIALKYSVMFSWDVGAIYHQNAGNRACSNFAAGDKHPFIETASRVINNQGEAPENKLLKSYIDRLRIENAKQYVVTGQYHKAKLLIGECSATGYFIQKLIWGTQLNVITHLIWKIKKLILPYLKVS